MSKPGKVALLSGEELPTSALSRSGKPSYYMTFPPFPSVLMLPVAALGGKSATDTPVVIAIASLFVPLFFLLLVRLRTYGFGTLNNSDIFWIATAGTFGSVFLFSAVQGSVWYAAHVIGGALLLAFLNLTLGCRFPLLAGLALGFAATTRTPLAFAFPLFFLEACRVHQFATSQFWKVSFRFAAPVAAIATAMAVYNYYRFQNVLEFGHSFLAVKQQFQMEALGLFDLAYLKRNLFVAFGLTPQLSTSAPYIAISGHGLAVWITMPYLLLLISFKTCHNKLSKHASWALFAAALVVALPTLFYQNTGWIQFGYRFCLDYLLLLLLAFAIRLPKLRLHVKFAIALAVAINLFGAITFGQWGPCSHYDTSTYETVSIQANASVRCHKHKISQRQAPS